MRFLPLIVTLTLLTGAGCGRSPGPPPAARQGAVDDLLNRPGKLLEEQWDAHYVRQSKVGSRHTRIFRLTDTSPALLRIEATDRLEMRRFGDVAQQELTSISVETEAGEVRQLSYRVKSGDVDRSASGRVVGGYLELLRPDAAPSEPVRYEWSDRQGGIFAIERSLRRQPLQPGERRTVEAFVPLLDRIVQFELIARQLEPTQVQRQAVELLRIEATDPLADGWKIPTVFWTRPDGVIVKTQEAFLQRETVLVDSAEATKPNDLVRVDLGIDVGVRLEKPIADPLRVDQAVYKVQVEGLSPFDVFANGLSQRVLASVKDPGAEGQTLNDWALVTVSRVSPDEPAVPDVEVPGPTPEDTAPNALIQSDHPRVVALAEAVAGVVNDPWRAAMLLEDYLFRTLGKVDYSQVFSSAGVVAEQRKGDCSEHAVLLAATCRARGIPARVAIGLVYSAEDQSFLYHMWNEVWIRDRWVPLDATLGRGGVGACHLKLRDSSLARQSPYSLVSPVIYLIDRLKIEVVSVE